MKSLGILSLALAALVGTAQADELFNNGPVVGSDGKSVRTAAALSFALGMQTKSNNAVADDFTVASGSSWRVSSLDFFGYQTSATTFTFQDVSWSILAGDVINGMVMASGTTALVSGGQVGFRVASTLPNVTTRRIFRASADIADISLDAGHYWLRWNMTSSATTSGPFQVPTSDGRTGNAMSSAAGGDFKAFIDEGSSKTVELPFVINGTVSVVPEPSTWLLMLAGGLALALRRRV